MKKITTLFKKNPDNLALVINEVSPENQWVFTDANVKATQKFDGTACAIIEGLLYKRYDAKLNPVTNKPNRPIPDGAIPCQDPDTITGHWPHWLLCEPHKPEDKYFLEGLKNCMPLPDGTYELCGPKIQGNPERFERHELVKHGAIEMTIGELSYNGLKDFLKVHDIEGLVFYHSDGRMCKIRKSDFGIKR